MEAIKALMLTIIVPILSAKVFLFYILSHLLDSLQYKQSLVPFKDSSSHSEKKLLRNSQNQQEITESESLFL